MTSKFPPKKPEQYIFKPAPKHEWNKWQQAIFKNVSSGTGHTIIEAYAGSGKTTTIIESFRYIPRGKKSIALAFNKIIQEELQARAPNFIEKRTFHSIGLQCLKQRFGNIEIDDNKAFNIVKSILDTNTNNDLIVNLCDAIAFCKYGLLDTPSQIDDLIDRFGIDVCDLPRSSFIELVIKALGECKRQTNIVDFNDMCYLPFVLNLPLGRFHLVFIDEYQDLNKSQLIMAKKMCDPNGGRIIATGDANQALYSWRLSDTSVMDEIRKQPTTKILTLPVSYRCPKKIIALAQHWVPDITCPDTAIEGEVHDISLNSLYDKATPGCFILSRTNAPLIKICMNFIRLEIKANIRGRDVGKSLTYLIRKSKKKKMDAFLKWLEDWKNEEADKLQKKNINPENILDRYECLVNICEECKTLDEVVKKVEELFNDTDEKNIVIMSTVHKAKGLERDDVFVLRWTFREWLDESLQFVEKPNEEINIAYVAGSRTCKRLFLVNKFI